MPSKILSSNDDAVLGALFDPEASLDRGSICVQPISKTNLDQIPEHAKQREQNTVKRLNIAEPNVQDIVAAVQILTSIIETYPKYASAYVNRAQARRLLPGSLDQVVAVGEIFSDLNNAISIANASSLTESITADDTRLLSSAYIHRGSLLLRASMYPEFRAILLGLNSPSLGAVVDASQFEELASKDFAIAGRYGNKTAQQLAVKTNPYAKLCGQIVREALQKEIKEYQQGVF